jgi:hypothetical protein
MIPSAAGPVQCHELVAHRNAATDPDLSSIGALKRAASFTSP